jgi:hypothetical protein
VVAVVRADEQVILADVFEQVGNVFVGLTGDEQPVIAAQLRAQLRRRPLLRPDDPPAQEVNQERNPGRRGLDKAESQPGNCSGILL